MIHTRNLLPFSLLLLLGVIWGTGYSIARFAMTHGVPPLGYSFWQCLGPALLLGLFCVLKPSNRITKLTGSTRKSLFFYLVCGLSGIVIPNTNMYFAAQHLPAGLLAVIVNTVPVIVNTVPVIAYPLALIARAETFDRLRLLGVLVAISGLMIIVAPKTLPSSTLIPWVLSTLITPLSFAFCSVYIARFCPKDTDTLRSATGTLLASSLMLMPFVLYQHDFYRLHFPLTLPDQIILLEILLSSIGYLLFFKLIKIAGPVYYSLVDTIVAITGLGWGYYLFNEQLNAWTSLAIVLILIALMLVNKRQREPVVC